MILTPPPLLRLRKSQAAPFREFPEPEEFDRGAGMFVDLPDGTTLSGQVWDDAPGGGVWLATGERFLWVHKISGVAYSPAAATTSARNRKAYLVGTARHTIWTERVS